MRLLLAAVLLAGCDGLSIAGSTDCLTVDEIDCEAAISAARVHLPPGYGTISNIRVDQDREGCPLGVCDTLRGTVTFTFWDTPNTVIVTVERSGESLRSMSAVDVEIVEPSSWYDRCTPSRCPRRKIVERYSVWAQDARHRQREARSLTKVRRRRGRERLRDRAGGQ